MRVLILANNWVGWKATEWLRNSNVDIVGAVIHAPNKQKYTEEIVKASCLDPAHIFDGSKLKEPETFNAIRKLQPDIGLSLLFDYILTSSFLDLLPSGCINLHPAYLPYNRGSYPNVFSIVECTPAGVSMHYMNAGIDTGDIISRREVPVEITDTGESLYRKLEHACIELLKETWPLLEENKAPRMPQSAEDGTTHYYKDVDQIDEIDLDATYTARELINIIRARTFPPYPGAYFFHNGEKIYMRIELLHDDQLNKADI